MADINPNKIRVGAKVLVLVEVTETPTGHGNLRVKGIGTSDHHWLPTKDVVDIHSQPLRVGDMVCGQHLDETYSTGKFVGKVENGEGLIRTSGGALMLFAMRDIHHENPRDPQS